MFGATKMELQLLIEVSLMPGTLHYITARKPIFSALIFRQVIILLQSLPILVFGKQEKKLLSETSC